MTATNRTAIWQGVGRHAVFIFPEMGNERVTQAILPGHMLAR